uniref:Ig-like domain-containing protein n=1 Tax=Pygocentrus nattereri TaxID=42514 RepID=A0AAR2J8Z2_PYGNA
MEINFRRFGPFLLVHSTYFFNTVQMILKLSLHIFEANVVSRISALTRSCVVIPCTFQIGDVPVTRLRGLWYTNNGEYVYHTGQTNILDNFKGRTKLLGDTNEQNCTLEIDDVQAHDNGPFCFHAEKGSDKYRFNHSCPVISDLPEELEPGKRYTISCSVTHTCPSHPPTITWSIPTVKKVVSHTETSGGQWKTISTVTYVPTGYEKEEDLICTASFWRGKKQEHSVELPLKSEYVKQHAICLICFICSSIFNRRSVWAQLSRLD